jgi:hypothetical protein
LGWTNLEGAEQTFVHAHHGAGVVELATVVGGAEQRNELTLGEELVAILYDLMCTADEVHVVFLEEAGDDVWAEGEGNSTVILGPPSDVLVRIRPEEIAEQAAVRDLGVKRVSLQFREGRDTLCSTYISRSHDAADLLHRV